MSKEIILDEYAFLVSEIDEEGKIRFVNSDFCDVSGFELDELLGENISVVRHRHMPQSLTDELLKTIKKGEIWTGYVINKTKNDDFFWTFTTVYPFINSAGTSGYLICRKKPAQKEIEEYSSLYKDLKNKE